MTSAYLIVIFTQQLEANQSFYEALGIQFEAGLENYRRQNNGRLPDRIIVYRDGIGDTMLHAMKETEINTMQSAVNRKYEACGQSPPNLIVVIVKKRINTRLFVRDRRGVDNPPPGTIVDTQITKPKFCDFYLVSQASCNFCVHTVLGNSRACDLFKLC